MDNTERLAAFQRDGYSIFESVYSEQQMAAWRAESDRLRESHDGIHAQPRSWWFGNMLERSPGLMWPVVSNPLIVEFMEQIVGPFVQLDNLTLAAFPPMSQDDAGDKVVELVSALPEDERKLVVHCGLEGLTPKSAADVTGLTPEAATKRWQRLRTRLSESPRWRALLDVD